MEVRGSCERRDAILLGTQERSTTKSHELMQSFKKTLKKETLKRKTLRELVRPGGRAVFLKL
jgi:hypothetical protein